MCVCVAHDKTRLTKSSCQCISSRNAELEKGQIKSWAEQRIANWLNWWNAFAILPDQLLDRAD